MHMVMFVLDDSDKLDDVMAAWRGIGVSGVTIIETTGYYRRQQAARPLGARYWFASSQAAASIESGHYTLMVIVPGIQTVHRMIEAAEKITGNLDDPNTGVIAAWPLAAIKGVPRELLEQDEDKGQEMESNDQ
jgi:hypothetical protein